MLATNNYPQQYIDDGRALVAGVVAAFRGAAGTHALEPLLCNGLVLVLDHWFVHRMRGAEGKDGNPINEVRMLATSVEQHGAVLTADSTIKYRPEASVLGLAIGDRIHLDADGFERLAAAYFAAIEDRFT